MPDITVDLTRGTKYYFKVRPSEVAKYFKNGGLEKFPKRPKFPFTLWVLDIVVERARAEFVGQKPVKVTIEGKRGFTKND